MREVAAAVTQLAPALTWVRSVSQRERGREGEDGDERQPARVEERWGASGCVWGASWKLPPTHPPSPASLSPSLSLFSCVSPILSPLSISNVYFIFPTPDSSSHQTRPFFVRARSSDQRCAQTELFTSNLILI